LSREGCPDSASDTCSNLEARVNADLDTLATALYVTTDDLLIARPERVPPDHGSDHPEGQRRRDADVGGDAGTVGTLPVGWALSGAKADDRELLNTILESTPALWHKREDRQRRQVVIADKAYFGRGFEAGFAVALPPAR